MMDHRAQCRERPWTGLLFTAVVVVMATVTACTGGTMNEQPPETAYNEAEAFAPMEAEVADTIAVLPEFPGFDSRSWNELPCSHNGIDDSDYVNIEIRYGFDDADSATPLVRETFVDVLRERWTELGYDIHRDEPSATGKYYALEARRDDGINLWYRVATGVTLLVQSGCVPKSDPGEIQYLPPAGGLVPGSEWDTIDIDGVQGLPEAPSEEAVSPFSESESPSPAGMVPWNREADPSESGPSPYEGQL
jgi:hypothetical protein